MIIVIVAYEENINQADQPVHHFRAEGKILISRYTSLNIEADCNRRGFYDESMIVEFPDHGTGVHFTAAQFNNGAVNPVVVELLTCRAVLGCVLMKHIIYHRQSHFTCQILFRCRRIFT